MGSLTALLLATPIFGFSLHAPLLDSAVDVSAKQAVVVALAAKTDPEKATPGPEQCSEEVYKEDLKIRNSLASLHRVFGISTWIAMTLTLVSGAIDYNNIYGFGAGIGDNPCVKGTAVFGDEFGCRGGIRTIKSGLAYLTTALYTTTFVISLMMPDPDDLSSGPSDFASTLRLHKTLRWVHFGGMVAQIALGVLIASRVGGLDRANDFDTLQTLATAHMGIGLVTWGAMTWAGALMTF